MKILLDPNIYILDLSQSGNEMEELEHYIYFNRTIKFIAEYLQIPIAYSDLFYEQLCCKLKEYPWNQYKAYREHRIHLLQTKLLHCLDQDYAIISKYENAKCAVILNNPDRKHSLNVFLKYITYAYNNEVEILPFMGKCHHALTNPIDFEIGCYKIEYNAIFDPYIDCYGQLRKLLLENPKLKKYPSIEAVFPNKELCVDLNNEFMRRLTNGESKIELIIKIGTECACRNLYEYDHILSHINQVKSGSRRLVFKSQGDESIYLSADFESGGFEVFDHSPMHLGQFSFDGYQIKGPRPVDHKLYTKL